MKMIELLAPARNLEAGMVAVDCGADAVYIGGPSFGARAAAGNSIEDIARLTDYCRPFNVKVYGALNTLVYEDELHQAETIAREFISAGVNALIIQDPAFLMMGLKGVDFHASTQMCNYDQDWINLLGHAGITRVVLERGLTLEQVREIRKATTLELESFIHGAICVGYSGMCYFSKSMGKRSGNRGECGQPCRLPYDLVDETGRVWLKDKHLLSVKDLDLTSHLGELMDAGIQSFKIEGRLKDIAYVKNVVSHYRQQIDNQLAKRPGFEKSSAGMSLINFSPSPVKTFSRGGSAWMLNGKVKGVSSFDTPKAKGEYIGKVTKVYNDHFEYFPTERMLNPGDGICFCIDGRFVGTNVNNVQGRKVYPNKIEGISSGIELYRNHDHQFVSTLEKTKIERRISICVKIDITEKELVLNLTDGDGNHVRESLNVVEWAQNPAKSLEQIKTQLTKLGDSIFRAEEVFVREGYPGIPFFRISELNNLRRATVQKLISQRKEFTGRHVRVDANRGQNTPIRLTDRDSGTIPAIFNITNSLSRKFFESVGLKIIPQTKELAQSYDGMEIMRTPFCVRRELGKCLKKDKNGKDLYIVNNGKRYLLKFDCDTCEMIIVKIK